MKKILSTLVISLILISCGTSADESDNQHVTDALETRIPIEIVNTIGVDLGDTNYVFGTIQDLGHGPDGNIYMLDRAASCVRVFSPDGEFIRQISRSGNGPGEITMAFSMAVLGDGRITVCAPMQGGMHIFYPDGEWEGLSAEFTNNPPMNMIGADSNAYIASKLTVDMIDGNLICFFHVGRYEENNEPSVKYYEDEFPFDPQDLTELLKASLFSTVYTADRSGNVYMAPCSTEDYMVQIFNKDGELLNEFSREFLPVAKNESEINDEKLWMENWLRSIGAQGVVIDYEPEPYRYMISALGVDAADRIWVQRGTEITPVFDVYTQAGELLFTAEVQGAGDDAPFWKFIIDEYGMMAYSENPEYYYEIFLMDMPE